MDVCAAVSTPAPASTTAGVETGVARPVSRWLGLLRSPLQLRPPTIDQDCTEVACCYPGPPVMLQTLTRRSQTTGTAPMARLRPKLTHVLPRVIPHAA